MLELLVIDWPTSGASCNPHKCKSRQSDRAAGPHAYTKQKLQRSSTFSRTRVWPLIFVNTHRTVGLGCWFTGRATEDVGLNRLSRDTAGQVLLAGWRKAMADEGPPSLESNPLKAAPHEKLRLKAMHSQTLRMSRVSCRFHGQGCHQTQSHWQKFRQERRPQPCCCVRSHVNTPEVLCSAEPCRAFDPTHSSILPTVIREGKPCLSEAVSDTRPTKLTLGNQASGS